jgi:hypothetical protein
VNSSLKRSSSDDHTSTLAADEEEESSPREMKSIVTTGENRTRQMPKIQYTTKLPSSSSTSLVAKNEKSSSLKWSTALTTRK